MEKRDMLIKVCGMREAENIAEVEALGIDFMGFICWSKSPRALTEVPEHLPTACRRVGVFVNETVQGIVERVASLGLNAIQLHGNETPDLCRELRALPALQGVDIFKAFCIAEAKDLEVCLCRQLPSLCVRHQMRLLRRQRRAVRLERIGALQSPRPLPAERRNRSGEH
jgi:phosphoribosylanthranilate isomerase